MPIGQACVPITDWGFLRSDATYDVVTVWEGAFFRLDAHLERFFASCRSFRLDPGKTTCWAWHGDPPYSTPVRC